MLLPFFCLRTETSDLTERDKNVTISGMSTPEHSILPSVNETYSMDNNSTVMGAKTQLNSTNSNKNSSLRLQSESYLPLHKENSHDVLDDEDDVNENEDKEDGVLLSKREVKLLNYLWRKHCSLLAFRALNLNCIKFKGIRFRICEVQIGSNVKLNQGDV